MSLTGRFLGIGATSHDLQEARGRRLTMLMFIAVGAPMVLAAACSGADSTDSTGSTSADAADIVLLSGAIEVPAADAFGDPGFHEPFTLAGTIPESAAGFSGDLVVRLADRDRPDQSCDRDHPLSGCATVDWSDSESRPRVPAGGVFDNRLSLVLTSGPIELFLSETGVLAEIPDRFSPT